MKRTQYIKMAVLICISFVFVCYSYAGNPKAPPFLPDIPKEWTKVTPGPTDFMGRVLVPTCSNYPGTDPTFSFFVKGGSVNNLVVYFQGGGACWNSLTCVLYPANTIYSVDVTDSDNPINYRGMFDFSNPKNPFKDWSFVFIPYCTGDVHLGSKDATYYKSGTEPWTIHHRGFDNFLVVLDWITKNFEKPHDIFVSGSSAGSYGAIGLFPWIKEAYPNSKVYVLGDAGMGVTPTQFDRRAIWNIQYPEWIFGDNPPNIPTPEAYKIVAEYYPHNKLAQFTAAWDGTQTLFYNLIVHSVGASHGPNVCVDWHDKMIASVDYEQEAPNYRSYIAAGTYHTILASPTFYTENSAGISFLDWVDTMVSNQGGTNGHGGVLWENMECTECGAPTSCPYVP